MRCVGAVLAALCLAGTAQAYMYFQDRLPNGGMVPHPCRPNYVWKGVGHEAVPGGGRRNPFGEDFAANGFKWDACLCNQDSDGDGLTNGQELGDPDCTWTPGTAPKHKFGLSHPGVCEPLDDPECAARNDFEINCEDAQTFTCDAINSPDVKSMDLQYPETAVPAKETSYMCMSFQLPSDDDFHIIAYEPLIDNENVMHHIVVFGCNDDVEITTEPEECGMGFEGCQSILALWAVGVYGDCLPPEYGMAIGRHGFSKVVIQMHWTNPAERTDYTDGSGMRIFYTPQLRPNSAKVLQHGQYYLQIPPGKSQVASDALCSSECTAMLNHSIYISDVNFHMHYMGHAGYTELWRDGNKVTDLVATDDYDYDNPSTRRHYPAVEMKPGDELRTRCIFNSRNQDSITYFGEGSYDEMCISFVTYYPADDDFIYCGQYFETNSCSIDASSVFGAWDPEGCDYEEFLSRSDITAIFAKINELCDETGAECLPGCREQVEELHSHHCMQGDKALMIESFFHTISEDMKHTRNKIRSCVPYALVLEDGDDNRTEDDDNQGPARYDPERNNLPAGGVCPWTDGNEPTGGSEGVHAAPLLCIVAMSLFAIL